MCHLILSSNDKDYSSNYPVKNLQRKVVEILSCSSVARVMLKLACVDVVTLHALMANEVGPYYVNVFSSSKFFL